MINQIQFKFLLECQYKLQQPGQENKGSDEQQEHVLQLTDHQTLAVNIESGYEDMTDNRSYAHNLSSCEIKA